MTDEQVHYKVVDEIAWLTIDRPEARNALGARVREGLWQGVRRFNDDDDAKVLVLTGTGDVAFCAGADLKELASARLTIPPSDFVPIFGRNITVEKPTIAAVNGVAIAGGFLMAQMCDLCLAAEHANFAITEARVGRGAPWAAPLPWMIPPRVALQLLMTAQPISAERAYQVGLVNEVVPADQLQSRAQELARTIAVNAPLTLRASKRMFALASSPVTTTLFEPIDRLWDEVYLSEDAQEGPRAFKEKRAPRWQGK